MVKIRLNRMGRSAGSGETLQQSVSGNSWRQSLSRPEDSSMPSPAARHKQTSCAGFAVTAAVRPPSSSRWSRRCSSRCCSRSSRLAMVFFASQVLETVTQDSARMIMTGQAQNAAFTQAQFKNLVCSKLAVHVRLRQRSLHRRAELSRVRLPSTSPIRSTRSKNFVPPNNYLPGATPATSSWCGCSTMAAVRHRARLQHREYRPAASGC